MRLKLILIAAVTALACLSASPTALAEKQTQRGEYFTGPSGENQYAVIYRGDTRMDRRNVAERAMLKAAELTLEKGETWFMVTNSSTQRINLRNAAALSELSRTPGAAIDTSAGTGAGQPGAGDAGHTATAGVDPGAVGLGTQIDPRLVERASGRERLAYQTTLIIKVGHGSEVAVADPANPPDIYDAAAIAQALRARVQP